MKKAIHVLVLLSKIFSIILCVLYLILAITNFAQAGGAPNPEIQAAFVSSGVGNLFALSFSIAAVIVTYLNGPKMDDDTASMKEAIVSIVFGVLGCPVLAAAGIVYVVWLSKKPKTEQIEAPKENE